MWWHQHFLRKFYLKNVAESSFVMLNDFQLDGHYNTCRKLFYWYTCNKLINLGWKKMAWWCYYQLNYTHVQQHKQLLFFRIVDKSFSHRENTNDVITVSLSCIHVSISQAFKNSTSFYCSEIFSFKSCLTFAFSLVPMASKILLILFSEMLLVFMIFTTCFTSLSSWLGTVSLIFLVA